MTTDLKSVVYQAIQSAAQPVATALNMPNMVPVDEASLGDFPWFWQNGTNFNAATFNWLNSLFAYDDDGYVGSNSEALSTSLYNVLSSTAYVLDAADNNSLNVAILANASLVNTLITDWTTTQGPIPATANATQAQQLNYITTQVIGWGAPGLTLQTLRNSSNPIALLPNVPVSGGQCINDLMAYLAATSSVANIQAAVLAFNNELAQVRANLVPQPPLTTMKPGYMTTIDIQGNTAIVLAMNIAESTAVIQNNLLPPSGQGKSFSVSFSATRQAGNMVKVSAESGGGGLGDLGFLIGFAEGSASYNMFSADASTTSCRITLTFNGVTTVTPSFAAYDVTSGTGWWFPEPIEEAANGDAGQSGYRFKPTPSYDFGVNGDFGAIARLMISQQPIITLAYSTSNYRAYQETFREQSHWGLTFLGIPLAGGSQSYFQASSSFDASSSTVTVTMAPVGITTPVTATSQLATVIGAQVMWPGASHAQNRAGI